MTRIKTQIKVILVAITLALSSSYAGSGHSHSHEAHGHSHHEHSSLDKQLASKEIQKIAEQKVQSLVLENKIPKTWKDIPISKVGKDSNGYSSDWVVMFKNEKVKKKSKQTLYIFVGLYGDVTGANYTGK